MVLKIFSIERAKVVIIYERLTFATSEGRKITLFTSRLMREYLQSPVHAVWILHNDSRMKAQ